MLNINAIKTKVNLFQTKNEQTPESDDIVLGCSFIEVVGEIKALGVFVSENLFWNNSVNNVVKKLPQVIG